MTNGDLTTWLVLLTLGAYAIGCVLFQKLGKIWFSPAIISPLLIIAVLSLVEIDYDAYRSANRSITFFLGPAQMALMIPLYTNRHLLKRYFRSIIGGVMLGSGAGIACAVGLASLLGLAHPTIASLIPKSVTTPIAVSVSQLLGGLPELTAFFAVLTGITAILIGPPLLHLTGVRNNLYKGLALGTAASLVGVSRAAQWGEKAAVMGSLGMTVTAALVSVLSPELGAFGLT